MMKKVLTCALFAFSASSVFAANPSNTYTILDVNKDGLVSKDEANVSKTVSQQWDKLDQNKDGYLDSDEFIKLSEMQK